MVVNVPTASRSGVEGAAGVERCGSIQTRRGTVDEHTSLETTNVREAGAFEVRQVPCQKLE